MPGRIVKCLDCTSPSVPGRSRCLEHGWAHEKKRQEARNNKYDNPDYRRQRKYWRNVIDELAAQYKALSCPRCDQPIIETDVKGNTVFDLGHQDDGTLHPEHRHCNRRAGGKNAMRATTAKLGRKPTWITR